MSRSGRPSELRTRLELDLANVAVARAFVRESLGDLGLGSLDDVAVLLTSEVVTNAFVHAGTGVDLAVIGPGDDTVRIEVRDRGAGRPEIRPSEVTSLGGRGVGLVDRLARAWGVDGVDGDKTVWFELAAPNTN